MIGWGLDVRGTIGCGRLGVAGDDRSDDRDGRLGEG